MKADNYCKKFCHAQFDLHGIQTENEERETNTQSTSNDYSAI